MTDREAEIELARIEARIKEHFASEEAQMTVRDFNTLIRRGWELQRKLNSS